MANGGTARKFPRVLPCQLRQPKQKGPRRVQEHAAGKVEIVVRDLVAFGPMSTKFVLERCERVREMIAVCENSLQIASYML